MTVLRTAVEDIWVVSGCLGKWTRMYSCLVAHESFGDCVDLGWLALGGRREDEQYRVENEQLRNTSRASTSQYACSYHWSSMANLIPVIWLSQTLA